MNTVDKIFDFVRHTLIADRETVNSKDFTSQEFGNLCDYLSSTYRNNLDVCSVIFVEKRLYLQYKGYDFIYRFLRGIGDCEQILHSPNNDFSTEKYPLPDVPLQFKNEQRIFLPDDLSTNITIKEIIE